METAKQGPKENTIHIDKHVYKVSANSLTGTEIRNLVAPPLASTYDLYLEVPGKDDHLVGNDESITLKPGMHFFSAPGNITPGR
ncbi:multiubiquitin domain-containing protein [Arthrobacter sp. RCC_34]|uniref:multiubiquitin domain-containing protein n=1 Tax=Arthrobacter sp. RCC_34 TaxID=3239230 RepID=UPI003524A067